MHQDAYEEITKKGNTVNICFIDLAFDIANQFGMYIKLMKRLVHTQLTVCINVIGAYICSS